MTHDPDIALCIFLFGNMALWFALMAPWGQWWNRRKLYWRDFRRSLMAGVFLLMLGSAVQADSIWTYAGPTMDGHTFSGSYPACACALTGTLTLDAAFQPLTWSFTNGTTTLDQTDSTIALDAFAFDATTPFFRWTLDIAGAGLDFRSMRFADPTNYEDEVTGPTGILAIEQGLAGTWTDPPVPTPEPATALLAAIALAIMALLQYHSHTHRRRIA